MMVLTAMAQPVPDRTGEDGPVQAAPVFSGRACGMAATPEGRLAWFATGLSNRTIYCLDTRAGTFARSFGRLGSPQGIAYCRRRSRLYVLDSDGRTPLLRVFDANSGRPLAQHELSDWRLRHITDIVTSPDGNSLLVSSQATCTDRDGYVGAAVFDINPATGAMKQIVGQTPQRGQLPDRYDQVALAADANGVLYVGNTNPNTLGRYNTARASEPKCLKLPFAPTHLRLGGKQIVAAGMDHVAILDCRALTLVKTVSLKGTPTALCVDPRGWMAFIAMKGSSEIRQLDLATGELGPVIDARRPGGTDVADAARGKEIHDIIAMAMAEAPRRLVGLGYDGYTPFTVTLDGKSKRYLVGSP